MPLNRATVDRTAGRHIADLQRTRHVSDAEKRAIRTMHERLAKKAEGKKRAWGAGRRS